MKLTAKTPDMAGFDENNFANGPWNKAVWTAELFPTKYCNPKKFKVWPLANLSYPNKEKNHPRLPCPRVWDFTRITGYVSLP